MSRQSWVNYWMSSLYVDEHKGRENTLRGLFLCNSIHVLVYILYMYNISIRIYGCN